MRKPLLLSALFASMVLALSGCDNAKNDTASAANDAKAAAKEGGI